VVVTSALLAASLVVVTYRHGLSPLGLTDPLTPLSTNAPGGLAVAVLRVVALLLVVAAPSVRVRTAALCVLGFVASLAWKGVGVPFLLVCVVLAGFAPRGKKPHREPLAGGFPLLLPPLVGIVALALAGGVMEVRAVLSASTRPSSIPDQIAWYADRGNLFRARALARTWCERELPPGPGCLVLAHVSRKLNQVDEAKRVLEQIVVKTRDAQVRGRAQALLGELEGTSEER